jgi:hypothetical protein
MSYDPADDDPGQSPDVVSGLPRYERDYIIPAQDVKGHSIRLYCRAAPTVARLIGEIIGSKKYPFRTQGDLIRWCIVHGAKRLAAGQQIAPGVLMHIDAANAVLAEEEYQLAFREFFNRLRAVVDQFLEQHAKGEARRVVSFARGHISQMPEGYWRERYLKELLDRYGELLDAEGQGANMLGDEGEQGGDT